MDKFSSLVFGSALRSSFKIRQTKKQNKKQTNKEQNDHYEKNDGGKCLGLPHTPRLASVVPVADCWISKTGQLQCTCRKTSYLQELGFFIHFVFFLYVFLAMKLESL